ncbi:hypothetical protein, partial [Escherichia coli]|uniref:hypothetical protein n=1 Tax=Escherichia coli TaxID=562 RepID=UPI0022F09746
MWRVRSGTLGINDAGANPNPKFELYEQLSYKASISTYLGAMYVGTETAGGALYLRSGAAATALTLSSSQNM